MSPAEIAKVCHEINRAYCHAIGDDSQLSWDQAPEWQRQSAIHGVEFSLAHPTGTPKSSHDNWMAEKKAAGWKHGPIKDPGKKEHPAFLPYDELPVEQKVKDYLFQAVVRELA